jgi:hypothetical protein
VLQWTGGFTLVVCDVRLYARGFLEWQSMGGEEFAVQRLQDFVQGLVAIENGSAGEAVLRGELGVFEISIRQGAVLLVEGAMRDPVYRASRPLEELAGTASVLGELSFAYLTRIEELRTAIPVIESLLKNLEPRKV